MFNLQDSTVYFIGSFYASTIVMMGAHFMLKLVLAVILRAFEKVSDNED